MRRLSFLARLALPGALVAGFGLIVGAAVGTAPLETADEYLRGLWHADLQAADPVTRGTAALWFSRRHSATDEEIHVVARLLSDSAEWVRTAAASSLIAVGSRIPDAGERVTRAVNGILHAGHDSSTAELAAIILEELGQQSARPQARAATTAAYSRKR